MTADTKAESVAEKLADALDAIDEEMMYDAPATVRAWLDKASAKIRTLQERIKGLEGALQNIAHATPENTAFAPEKLWEVVAATARAALAPQHKPDEEKGEPSPDADPKEGWMTDADKPFDLAELERLDESRIQGLWTTQGACVISLEAPTPADQPYGREPLTIADCDMDSRIGYDLRAVPTAEFIAALANAAPSLLSRVRDAERCEKALEEIAALSNFTREQFVMQGPAFLMRRLEQIHQLADPQP